MNISMRPVERKDGNGWCIEWTAWTGKQIHDVKAAIAQATKEFGYPTTPVFKMDGLVGFDVVECPDRKSCRTLINRTKSILEAK